MPNINKTFTKGRMNLDLDDRIIPNGEYREALNVQVSTSDNSDVGSVQNILGNTLRNAGISSMPTDAFCVGQIADEKNNKLYYIVQGVASGIIEYDIVTSTNQIILVDADNSILKLSGSFVTGINIVDDFLFFTDGENEPKKINIQQFKNNSHSDFNTTSDFYVDNVSQGTLLEEHITVIKRKPEHALKVELVGVNAQGTFGLTLPVTITTADVYSSANTQTVSIGVKLEEFQVSNYPNSIQLLNGVNIPAANFVQNAVSYTNAYDINVEVNDILLLSDPNAIGSLPTNAQVRAKVVNKTISAISLTQGQYSDWTVSYDLQILSVDSSTSVNKIAYDFQIENLNDILFDKDFARFGYRYKYQDGEYSAFSPFTQPAFLPGVYNIHPTREPYNTGMQNTIKEVRLKEFVTSDIPSGVVEIDLLYKADASPAIYTIDTVKPIFGGSNNPQWYGIDGSINDTVTLIANDPNTGTTAVAPASNTGYYSVTSDTIYGILPENQLLRPFDNVPKKAKAQDFTANRLIYGNYTQNLNIDFQDSNKTLTIDFENRKLQQSTGLGKRSVKSLRDYQLGVIYLDEFGRETPIFTGGNSSTKKLPFNIGVGSNFKGAASTANCIVAENIPIPTNPGHDAKFLKFYIKETASEYYNLVLDRVYRAEEDGNLWLSFPSSDRNKLKEEDFIILKKPLESDTQVDSDNKFKVIALQNEAPDFIRKKYRQLAELDGDGSLDSLFTNSVLQPRPLFNKFAFDKTQASSEDLPDIVDLYAQGKILHLKFSATDAGGAILKSKRYKITTVEVVGTEYFITTDKPLVTADSWIESSPGNLNNTLKTQVLIEEKELFEEFEGRFFVKILSDIITDEYLESQIGINPTVNNIALFDVFSLRDSGLKLWQSIPGIADYASPGNTGSISSGYSNTFNEWRGVNSVLTFGTGNSTSGWFVDQLHMAVQQPSVDPYANNGQPSAYKNPPNGSPSLGHSFDVSLSGNLFKASSSSPGIAWITGSNTNHQAANGGNTPLYNSTTTVGSKDFNIVDSLDGAVTTTVHHALSASGGLGAKAWKKHLGAFSDVGEQVYGQPGETGKFFLHLSFSAVGEDLYDGSSPIGTDGGQDPNDGLSYNGLGGYKWAQGIGNGSTPRINLQNIENHNNQKNYFDRVCSIESTINPNINSQYDVNKIKNQWNPAVNNPANQQIIDALQQGNKIKVGSDADPARVFTIKNVTKKRIYNHTSWNRRAIWNTTNGEWVEDTTSVHYAWWSLKLIPTGVADGIDKLDALADALKHFGAANNRRVCYIIELDDDIGSTNPINSGIESLVDTNTSTTISIQQNYVDENSTVLSDNPAVFETEPRTDEDLDIYFEASGSLPIDITTPNMTRHIESMVPVGTKVEVDALTTGQAQPIQDNVGCVVEGWSNNMVTLNPGISANPNINYNNAKIRFVNSDGSYVQYKIFNFPNGAVAGRYKDVALEKTIDKVALPYYNCFTFNNGVESNRIRDDFNRSFIKNGVKASSTIKEQYKEDERVSGLIYSGIYNKNTSLNELNQFRMAEVITKDLEPTYGSIQKLHARDSDLIALCEDKIVQITADKDIIFNADGNPQLTASNKVLGQSRPFVGEYGISKNPESFASASYRAYFTDKQRGAVMRLSMDGLTPISEAGMKDWFRDKFNNDYFSIVGSYDDNKDTYNLTFDIGALFDTTLRDTDYRDNDSVTISYKEGVKGWVSFRSFIQEGGVTLNNTYFTFRDGELYSHDNETRNNFYGTQYESFVAAIFNDIPTSVKNFNTLNYSGSSDWKVSSITTDMESGLINNGEQIGEFLKKENKYFSYIYNENTDNDTSSFSFQGIGNASDVEP